MYIKRQVEKSILAHITSEKDILVVYGARQVGKSTMLNKVLDELNLKTLRVNGEEFRYQRVFSSLDLRVMQDFVEGYDVLFIDEAQNIENIGVNIKILYDAKPELKIILSGSSSFELANSIKEPLTGRTKTILLYPLGFSELSHIFNTYELKEFVKSYLVLGGYPRLMSFSERKKKIRALDEMASSYLYKDVLTFAKLKNSKMLYDLLRLLAFQIGNLVSIHELAKTLKTTSETVERYIDLLEKSFVVFRLSGFSKNRRKEIAKMDKIFFFDVGIRNAIIGNFSPLNNRTDVGQLWENFLILERLKVIEYNEWVRKSYFWRTYSGVEIDYVEEYDGRIDAYEFKWGQKTPKVPITWTKNYPDATYQVVNKEIFLDFVNAR